MQKRYYFPLAASCFALTFAFSLFTFSLKSQSGCPGCVVTLPPLPADTIYLGTAPDGVAGEPYDGDLSFRMPKTTTPVNAQDPSTPAGLGISKITIVAVVNVPPGLNWEANKTEFDPSNETDGCVKFCGTPLQPGLYEVEVFVTAEVLFINQSTSFSFPIYIAPAGSANDGFSMQNSSGCGEVTVNFQNNLPANGNPGVSYAWDFGNGQTSQAENPGDQTYSSPGSYPVHFQATIDTIGYLLTTVKVLDAGCNDLAIPPIFNGAPDLYLKIKDPAGNLILETDPVDNAPVPFAFNVSLPPLDSGSYEIEIRDEDTFGSDGCGKVNFNQLTTDTLASGDLKIQLNIAHPVFTLSTTDTVTVFAEPVPPVLEPADNQQICIGEEVELVATNYTDNIQWHKDTTVLFGETSPLLVVDAPGSFWLEYTSPDGCKSQSEPVQVSVLPLPNLPAFHASNNLLLLNDPTQLPANYSLQWYLNNNLLPGETGDSLCVTTPGTQLYTLVVTNNATGCTNSASLGATFNPNFNCGLSGSEGVAALAQTLLLSPNPADEFLEINFATS
ncbi:MAG: PKD domain-containing protein, partial [Bacteroidota bacterium]